MGMLLRRRPESKFAPKTDAIGKVTEKNFAEKEKAEEKPQTPKGRKRKAE